MKLFNLKMKYLYAEFINNYDFPLSRIDTDEFWEILDILNKIYINYYNILNLYMIVKLYNICKIL